MELYNFQARVMMVVGITGKGVNFYFGVKLCFGGDTNLENTACKPFPFLFFCFIMGSKYTDLFLLSKVFFFFFFSLLQLSFAFVNCLLLWV